MLLYRKRGKKERDINKEGNGEKERKGDEGDSPPDWQCTMIQCIKVPIQRRLKAEIKLWFIY